MAKALGAPQLGGSNFSVPLDILLAIRRIQQSPAQPLHNPSRAIAVSTCGTV